MCRRKKKKKEYKFKHQLIKYNLNGLFGCFGRFTGVLSISKIRSILHCIKQKLNINCPNNY